MSRFVVLEHDHPYLHWDLMLEVGEVLWTWRLDAPPAAGTVLGALRVGDHRPFYLTYEGPVSGNRGVVRRWDHGESTWSAAGPDVLFVELRGQRVTGTLELRRRTGESWEGTYCPSRGD
jgi:hypothetical protein